MHIEKKKRFSITEILIILICLLFIGLSYFGLENIDEFLAQLENRAKRPQVGIIANKSNDVRYRNSGSYVWFKGKENQNIYLGDSVYTGEKSQTAVKLVTGAEVVIGEKSAVVFRNLDELSLPDLAFGNFKLKLNGISQLSIAGEVIQFDGRNSEVQIIVDANKKASYRLLSGDLKIKSSLGGEKKLAKDTFTRLPGKEGLTTSVRDLQATFAPQVVNRYWRLYDFYEIKNSIELEKKSKVSDFVFEKTNVTWQNLVDASTRTNTASANTQVQLAKEVDFLDPQNFSTRATSFTFEKLAVGMNYWRVSNDQGQTWSQPQSIKLNISFMKNAAPLFEKRNENIPLFKDSTTFDLNARAPANTIGYVAEASYSPTFESENTRAFYKAGPDIRLSFYKEGTFYYRFRTILKDQALSEWSEVQKFVVYRPERPAAPVLAHLSSKKMYIGDKALAKYKTTGVITEIQVLNSKNKVVASARGSRLQFQPDTVGEYKIFARSFNEFGQAGPNSLMTRLQVLKAPTLNIAKVKKKERRTAAANEDSAPNINKLDIDDLNELTGLNSAYKKSHFSVQGLLWTLQSSEQVATDADRAIAGGIGLRGVYWLGQRAGLEGLFKSQVFDASTDTKSRVNSLEARFHMRHDMALPISFLPRMQISAFGGVEAYKNSGNLFTSQYEIFKFGTSMAFPLAQNWSTGGEFVYGVGSDSSTKAEISGFISRFFSREWSFGVGYRLTFFEAGSTSSTPTGTLPYREGYTEGFSALYYHF